MKRKKVLAGILAASQLVSAGVLVSAESIRVGGEDVVANESTPDLDDEVTNDVPTNGGFVGGGDELPEGGLNQELAPSQEEEEGATAIDPENIPLLNEDGEKLLRQIYGGWSQARNTPVQVGVNADHTLKLPGVQTKYKITRVGVKEEAGKLNYVLAIEKDGKEEVVSFDYQADPKGDNKLILDGQAYVYTGFNGPTQYEPDAEKGSAQHAYQDLHGEWLDIDNNVIEINEFDISINHQAHKIQRVTTSLEGPTRNVVFLFNTEEGLHLRYNVDKGVLDVAGLPQSSTFEVNSEFVRSDQAEETFRQRREEAEARAQAKKEEEERLEQERLEKEERDKKIAEEAAKKKEEEEQARKEEAERVRKENEERAKKLAEEEKAQRDEEARQREERKRQQEEAQKEQERLDEEERQRLLEEAEKEKEVQVIEGETTRTQRGQLQEPRRTQNVQQQQHYAQQQQRQAVPMPRTQQPGQGQAQHSQATQQNKKVAQNDLPATGEVVTSILGALGAAGLGGVLEAFRRRRK